MIYCIKFKLLVLELPVELYWEFLPMCLECLRLIGRRFKDKLYLTGSSNNCSNLIITHFPNLAITLNFKEEVYCGWAYS